MTKKPDYSETDAFGKHEVLDRAFLVQDIIEGHLMQHASVRADPEIQEAAQRLWDAAFALYQLCGAKFL